MEVFELKNNYRIKNDIAIIEIVYKGDIFEMTIDKTLLYKLENFKKIYLLPDKHTQYAVVKFVNEYGSNTSICVHRIITNCPKGKCVDHINHNGLDNRLENLKIVTNSENLLNRKTFQSNNKLKALNVYFKKKSNRFIVQFKKNKKTIHEKSFKYFDEAKEYVDSNRKNYAI